MTTAEKLEECVAALCLTFGITRDGSDDDDTKIYWVDAEPGPISYADFPDALKAAVNLNIEQRLAAVEATVSRLNREAIWSRPMDV